MYRYQFDLKLSRLVKKLENKIENKKISVGNQKIFDIKKLLDRYKIETNLSIIKRQNL